MTAPDAGRKPLLEQLGRYYGEQHFAITFTAALAGDDAKRVTSKGWDRTAPLADGNYAAALIGNRGLQRNVAVVLRPSNLIVLECDSEPDLARIASLGLPQTLTVQSSEPYKRHFYFRPAPTLEALPYVAFRFESGKITADSGRYFLAPPSIHPSGAIYTFLPGLGPGELEIATLPEQSYRHLSEQARIEDRELREAIEHDPATKIRAGNRRDFLFRYACMLRRWGHPRDAILEMTLAYNLSRCDPPVEANLVAIQVDGAMKKQGDQEIAAATNGTAPPHLAIEPDQVPRASELITLETWREFEAKAHDKIPVLVSRLWPEAAFGFIAAPPKKGKTWIALSLALSIATKRPFLGQFPVPAALPVLYIALEGHRGALRARVGALARGLGLDPDSDQLENLHWLYKPPEINLADPEWANALREATASIGAAITIVDVLRAGARLKENDQAEFSALRRNLQPITDDGRSLCLLHHFGKLTETQKERDPGERMSGTGAMFGALDVAIYITGSDDNAKSLRLAFDARDIAAPEHLSVRLTGEGSGENGGYTYHDYAEWQISAGVDEDDLKAPAVELAQYIRDQGGEIKSTELMAVFDVSDHTLFKRRERLADLGIDYTRKPGKPGYFVVRPDAERLRSGSEPEQLRTSELGTKSAFHAGSPDAPNRDELGRFVPPKDPQMQGESATNRYELPTGEHGSASEHAEHSALEGEPEPFPHAEPELDDGT